MSWFSNIGKAIGKGAKDAGHAVGNAVSSPLGQIGMSFIPGIGPLAAAGIGAAAGAMKNGGNLKSAIVGGATGGLGKLATNKLGSLAKGAARTGSVLADGSGSTSLGDGESWMDKLKHLGGEGLDAVGGVGGLAKLGIAGAGLVGQHQQTNANNDYMNKLLALKTGQVADAKADYASRAPMRATAQDAVSKKLAGMGKNIFQPYLGGG